MIGVCHHAARLMSLKGVFYQSDVGLLSIAFIPGILLAVQGSQGSMNGTQLLWLSSGV
jgi:hypothetical protein